MIPAKRSPTAAQVRAGLITGFKQPIPVCPVTVLPYLTREGAELPINQIVPETAQLEQGNPPPDRGLTEAYPFPPNPDFEQEFDDANPDNADEFV